MTFEKDKLATIARVASVMPSKMTPGQYVAGMWNGRFLLFSMSFVGGYMDEQTSNHHFDLRIIRPRRGHGLLSKV